MVQDATEAEVELLRTQLSEVNGRVISKAVALRTLPGSLAYFLTLFVSYSSLGSRASEATPPPGPASRLRQGLRYFPDRASG